MWWRLWRAEAGLDRTRHSTGPAVTAARTPPTGLGPIDPLDIPGEIINEYTLAGGDCFNRFEGLQAGRRLAITARVDCDEPHWAEVYHTFELDAPHPAVYPGDDAVRGFALRVCYEQFDAFVGEIYELSVYEIGVFTPNRTNFDHEVARYRGASIAGCTTPTTNWCRARLGVRPDDSTLRSRPGAAAEVGPLGPDGTESGLFAVRRVSGCVRGRLRDRLHHRARHDRRGHAGGGVPVLLCAVDKSSATASAQPTGPTATTTGSRALGLF